MGKLDGKVAIVTGASRGIGQAIAELFAAEGANLMICARNAAELEAQRQKLATAHPKARIVTHHADVAKEADVDALFAAAVAAFGKVDIVVNNAGVYGPMGSIDTIDWGEWVQAIAINLNGLVYCCRKAVQVMKPHRSGKIRRVADRAHVKRHSGLVILRQRHVSGWVRGFADRAVLAVAHDSDDLTPRTLRAAETEPFPDYVLTFKVAAHERLVDDRGQRRACAVLCYEVAASKQCDAHRLKILQPDDVRVHRVGVVLSSRAVGGSASVGRLLTFDEETAGAPASAQRTVDEHGESHWWLQTIETGQQLDAIALTENNLLLVVQEGLGL